MQFVLGLHASFMAGYGIVVPIVRTRRKQQVKEETDLIYWSFFCILFFISGADLMVINAVFNVTIVNVMFHHISFPINTAVLGVLVMATAYLAFVIYYAKLRYKKGST